MPDYGWPFGDEFWKEKMFHLGASGVGQFYYFNPTLKLFGATLAQHATMNSVLQELTAYLGGAFSQPSTTTHGWIEDRNIRWNDTFFLSGSTVAIADTYAHTKGQRVWRLTCARCKWANCTATSSVTALKSCAKEMGNTGTVQTVPVGLWLHQIGAAPCTLTFQQAWICPAPQSASSANSKGRKCPQLEPETASLQSDFGSWILQNGSGNVSVSCAWENASRLLGPDGTTTWPLDLPTAAATKTDDSATVTGPAGKATAFSPRWGAATSAGWCIGSVAGEGRRSPWA